MAEAELRLALTVLRVVRGWTRGDLARASGLPKKLVVDTERGTQVPELKTVERLLFAMGYSIESLQCTRRFVQAVVARPALDLDEEWPTASEANLEPPAG